MTRSDSARLWIKSSHSGDAGGCVEIAYDKDADRVLVRDSKAPDGSVLLVSGVDWRAFIAHVKRTAGDDHGLSG